ncbi:uncharacterized protein LOC126380643 isoform X5 [Pectinophora gossypiella]|uniref:uncharacterized protein LOC126380643 isoform X5 n=1 Tax=Pectinophora gossypiella TaxID=13191 RepID=UPI00214E41D2|nr:uncharacterized protein LOC126380643 isoform X5 [Pectinophora gossypiella]
MALVLNKFKYVDEKSYSNMLRLYLLVLTLPWTQQHLLSPDDYCALSTTCVHDGVKICARSPECGTRRAFLDLCDMYEYNCDYKTQYTKCVDNQQNGIVYTRPTLPTVGPSGCCRKYN